MTVNRTRGWPWLLLLAAGVLIVAVVAYRARRPGPTGIAPVATPEAVDTTPIFARWLRFEPEEVATEAGVANYYVDAVLGHQVFRLPPRGLHPQLAQQLLLDDDRLLLSSGRRLWNKELLHEPGLVGDFCYVHSTYCLKRLFEVSFSIDGNPVVIYDNQYSVRRYPSHTTVYYPLGGVMIEEHKFITYDDRAVATYDVRSQDEKPHVVTLEVLVPYPRLPGGGTSPPDYPLLGSGTLQGVPISLYLDAPGFARIEADRLLLHRRLEVAPDGSAVSASVAFRFADAERAQPATPLGNSPQLHQARDYNRWFADNVPYFDCSDPGFKKMWYYRWWIVRFHLVDGETSDLRGFRFYEGKLGFDNVIGFAVPAQIKELTYLRDPRFGLSQAQNSYRNRHENGAVVDPPGSPYWGETYSHWNAMALAEYHRVHPIAPSDLRELLPAMAADVRAWLNDYDRDQDALPERKQPRVTGYDLDILSYWYFNGTKLDQQAAPPALERVDFASFAFANADAVAELAREVGDDGLAREFHDQAERVRAATLSHLWSDEDQFFYPQRAADDVRIPIRELHGFFPFMTLLAPNEPRYTAALQKLIDPLEFWARFPPVITSQAHYREWTWEMDGLTRNIAPHPISMGGRTLLNAIKHYDSHGISADHFMELLRRYNDLVYPGVHPSDPFWRPNVHEYYSKWEPYAISPRPKPSDISHDFHSMYVSLIVEGAVGLTPRSDETIELQPLARQWSYFAIDGLRYRGKDLTIIWDQPDGSVRYRGHPEGFSLYIDGKLAFTRPTLGHVRYDTARDEVELVDRAHRPDSGISESAGR